MIPVNKIHDESLQSYIFRRILQYGDSDFSCLISRDGMWKVKVVLNSAEQNLFVNDGENKLVSLVKQNYSRFLIVSFYHNPFFYIELFKMTFKSENSLPSLTQFPQIDSLKKVIFFCHKCMIDSIRSFGYGYFKAEWDNQRVCEVHDVALSYLAPLTMKKATIAIKEIMQGKVPSSAIQCKSKEEKRIFERQIGFFLSPMSPCLLQLILNKLRRVVHEYYSDESLYDERLEKLMYSLDKKLLYASGLYKAPNAELIERPLRQLIDKQYQPIRTFISDLYEEVVTFNGVAESKSCSEIMVVPKCRDCLNCTHSKKVCSLSVKIDSFIISRNTQQLINENYCDRIKKNSTGWYQKKINQIPFCDVRDVYDDNDNEDYWDLKDYSYIYDLHDVLK